MVKGDIKHKKNKINRIKEVLVALDKSQLWLAQQMGRNPNTIASICNNLNQPHLKDLVKIAEILNVNVKELLHDTPVK